MKTDTVLTILLVVVIIAVAFGLCALFAWGVSWITGLSFWKAFVAWVLVGILLGRVGVSKVRR